MIRKLMVIMIILIFSCIGVNADGLKSPEKILFIGSFLTHWHDGLGKNIEELASSAKPRLNIETDQFEKDAPTLRSIWSYPEVHELIDNGNYDVIVLQDELSSTDVDTFHEYTRKFVAKIIEAGAEPVLFMSWFSDGILTTNEIAQAHWDIAAELGVKVAPVSLAMQNALDVNSELDMLDKGKRHPTIHGTYLMTCVLFTTLFERSPIGLSYLPKGYYGEVTEEEAAFLQRIAWETVQEYQTQQ